MNIAARLEQSAAPGEILIGEQTFGLTHGAVDVERREMELKCKSRTVPAYRLLSLRGDTGSSLRLDAPMVAREAELPRLREAFDDLVRTRACRLFTIVGAPGVGNPEETTAAGECGLAAAKARQTHSGMVIHGHPSVQHCF